MGLPDPCQTWGPLLPPALPGCSQMPSFPAQGLAEADRWELAHLHPAPVSPSGLGGKGGGTRCQAVCRRVNAWVANTFQRHSGPGLLWSGKEIRSGLRVLPRAPSPPTCPPAKPAPSNSDSWKVKIKAECVSLPGVGQPPRPSREQGQEKPHRCLMVSWWWQPLGPSPREKASPGKEMDKREWPRRPLCFPLSAGGALSSGTHFHPRC